MSDENLEIVKVKKLHCDSSSTVKGETVRSDKVYYAYVIHNIETDNYSTYGFNKARGRFKELTKQVKCENTDRSTAMQHFRDVIKAKSAYKLFSEDGRFETGFRSHQGKSFTESDFNKCELDSLKFEWETKAEAEKAVKATAVPSSPKPPSSPNQSSDKAAPLDVSNIPGFFL